MGASLVIELVSEHDLVESWHEGAVRSATWDLYLRIVCGAC